MKKILSTMLLFSFLMLPISGCSETNEPVSSLPESASAGDFAPISDGQPSETVETEPEEEAEEPVMDEEAYKATCQAYDYREIARYPSQYAGKAAYFCGEVFQVLEDGDTVNLMVNVTDSEWGWEDAVFVNYTRQSDDEPRVLEEDIVEIWGDLEELFTYEAVLGDTRSVPQITARYLNILSADPAPEFSSDDSDSVSESYGGYDDYGNSPDQRYHLPQTLSEEEAFDSMLAEAVPLAQGQGFLCQRDRRSSIIYECYTFSLYEDSPDHIATLGYYAVDPFGYVYEQDYLDRGVLYRRITFQSNKTERESHGIFKDRENHFQHPQGPGKLPGNEGRRGKSQSG